MEIPKQAAWVLFDLRERHVIEQARPDVLDTPVQPGSLMKIVTLEAAVETGLVSASTRILCPRRVRAGGRVLDCAHPDVGRPLSASEALSHSCNGFFAQLAPRLSRHQLDAAARRLGLPPVHAAVDPVLAALGLDAYTVPPRRWLDVLAILGDELRGRDGPLAVAMLRDGLVGAARSGTAVELGRYSGVLAKTGTASMPGGGIEGLAAVLDERTSRARALVVVAPGGAGRDAAAIAAAILAHAPVATPRPTSVETLPANDEADAVVVRLGVTHEDRAIEIRQLPLEDYVAAVVAGEAPGNGLPAVLEAMAIAARTVVVGRRGRHTPEGFDVCDTTHCQVVRPASGATRAAAAKTAGLVVTWQGEVAEIYYAASCGGGLADPGQVWPGRRPAWPPYLGARPDPAGDGGHEVRWAAEMPAAQVIRVLHAAGLRGDRLEDLAVTERDRSGRARRLRAAGFAPDSLAAETFRMSAGRVSGWALVKSTWFEVTRTARGYRFSGQGQGHGVGLCVRGAAALASRGHRAEEILAAYLPGTAIQPLPADRVTSAKRLEARSRLHVVLPAGDEYLRASIEGELTRFLRQASTRLSVLPPRELTLRFHPSVESYQRATGQPWWTSATASGNRVDLLPAQVLDSRHQLERSLRHEVVHVLTAAALEGRPLWVIEGLARHLTWARGGAEEGKASTRAPCPEDQEFAAAESAERLEVLYERSARCVARALAAGWQWWEVK